MDFNKKFEFFTQDGIPYQIKKITHADKITIENGFFQLSEKSIMFRFLELKKNLSEKELEYLSSPDWVKHVAFGAGIDEDGKRLGIGVARYIKIDDFSAEVAVTVIDRFQSQGVGKNLIKILIDYAKESKIKFLVGTVNCYNYPMLNILKKYPEIELKVDSSNYEVKFNLDKFN